MYSFLIFLFVVNTFVLMLAILMQSDKSNGLSSTFGGVSGAASSTFGTRETVTFLHKLTIILTTSFFILAIVIGLMSKAEFGTSATPDESVIMQKKAELPVSLPSLDQTTLPLQSDEKTEESSAAPAQNE
jgi:protein translocase SecG subunit